MGQKRKQPVGGISHTSLNMGITRRAGYSTDPLVHPEATQPELPGKRSDYRNI